MSIVLRGYKTGFCRMLSAVIWEYDREDTAIVFLAGGFGVFFSSGCVSATIPERKVEKNHIFR